MKDIGTALTEIMQKENCSSVHAFFMLADMEGDKYGLCKLQSKPDEKTSRRLRDKSNI